MRIPIPKLLHGVSLAAALGLLALGGCAATPTLYSHQQMVQLGAQAYSRIKQQTPASHNAALNSYVQCVVSHLAAQTPRKDWDVTVFKSEEANAFALPGGKIGIYTGILKYANTQAELAAVVGHEMGHVLANHINERMSRATITQLGLQAVGAAIGGSGSEHQTVMALLGVGAKVGLMLPFSREQESQADLIGLRLMAKAGFDPRAAIQLWKDMSQAGGGRPPEFLSTPPPPPPPRIAQKPRYLG
ncbi:MAG: M48 family metallopeptidase, partial [Gammaproteobacteria bacterium]|nr:M48 family metallopeptidase [Gammaproteobacteria bacterium]